MNNGRLHNSQFLPDVEREIKSNDGEMGEAFSTNWINGIFKDNLVPNTCREQTSWKKGVDKSIILN